jgi:hypothetical protein
MKYLEKLWKRFRKWLDDSVKPTLSSFNNYYDYEYSDLKKKEETKKQDKEKH